MTNDISNNAQENIRVHQTQQVALAILLFIGLHKSLGSQFSVKHHQAMASTYKPNAIMLIEKTIY
jgi:hypothetical protein